MAVRQLTAEDLRIRNDLLADFYTGTKEELIAAGVCKCEWFPKTLVLEFCKDGRAKIGNNGRQRYRRMYRVENASPAVELTHRRDAQGREIWHVRKEVDKQEAARRQVEHEAESARRAREDKERRREQEEQKSREREAARPTVEKLYERYPDLARIEGEIVTRDDGSRLQSLTFYARNLETLRRYELVTAEVLEVPMDGNYRFGDLKDGDRFYFYSGTDAGGAYCHITRSTEESPRERKHFKVTDARELLKKIAAQV